MIDVKDAVRNAQSYLAELYPADTYDDLMLEEVEISDDGREWMVTLGFNPNWIKKKPMEYLAGKFKDREYKIFKIDSETGAVKAMKIRDVD